MSRMIYILLVVVAARSSYASQIAKIVAFVGKNPTDSGCTDATVFGPTSDHSCFTGCLDNPGKNNWSPGAIDTFSGKEIGSCNEFEIDTDYVYKLVINHQGSDGVIVNIWKIEFDDGMSVYCEDGELIDDNEEHVLHCTSPE